MNYRILSATLLMALPIGACSKAPPPKPTTRAVNHTVAITWQNLSCNSTKGSCTGQLYRANSACPSSGIVGPAWIQLINNLQATTITSTMSTYNYVDSGVGNGQTYCYYSTNQYTANNGVDGPSGPSNTFQVQTGGTPPDAPTNLTGTVN